MNKQKNKKGQIGLFLVILAIIFILTLSVILLVKISEKPAIEKCHERGLELDKKSFSFKYANCYRISQMGSIERVMIEKLNGKWYWA